jgi:hypothetical protein
MLKIQITLIITIDNLYGNTAKHYQTDRRNYFNLT